MSAVGKRQRIACESITEGVRFSAPVYFNDGENMFLAANHAARKYHVAALKRWAIPFLWTDGELLEDTSPAAPAEDLSFEDSSGDKMDVFEEVQF